MTKSGLNLDPALKLDPVTIRFCPCHGMTQQIIIGDDENAVMYGYEGLQFGRLVKIAGVETFTPGSEADWRAGRF